MKTKTKKEIYYRCKKCGDEIYWNTRKQMIFCKCGALGVDGCEFYVRLIGGKEDYEEVKKIVMIKQTVKGPASAYIMK